MGPPRYSQLLDSLRSRLPQYLSAFPFNGCQVLCTRSESSRLGAGPHMDLGMNGLSHSNGLYANGAQSDRHIEALLSNLGPATPNPLNGSEGISLPSHSLNNGFNGFSPPKGLLHAPPPPPSLSTCTSLYVKNLPPETDRLWLYERSGLHSGQQKNSLQERFHTWWLLEVHCDQFCDFCRILMAKFWNGGHNSSSMTYKCSTVPCSD